VFHNAVPFKILLMVYGPPFMRRSKAKGDH
jgi:hypothetical protein